MTFLTLFIKTAKNPMHMYGLPDTPTKQSATEIKTGNVFYGKVVQKYAMYQSEQSRNGHKTSITNLINNDIIIDEIYKIMLNQYNGNDTIDRHDS